MTKEEYRAHTKFELVKINKRLYKNVCRLIRQKIELKEQIADIKANCDLAIEGRDVRIMELEKDNKLLEQRGSDILKELLDKNKRCIELEESNKELQKLVQQREQRGLEVQEDLLKEKEGLEQQIEKMKFWHDREEMVAIRDLLTEYMNGLGDDEYFDVAIFNVRNRLNGEIEK